MINGRLTQAKYIFALLTVGLIFRLFYWQILSRSRLTAMADSQHLKLIEIPAERGNIITSDGFTLVSNQPAYLAYAYRPLLKDNPKLIAETIAPLSAEEPKEATASEELKQLLIKEAESTVSARLANQDLIWIPLARKLSEDEKTKLASYYFSGIDFEKEQIRFYPEASMAAHLLGFLGSDSNGNPKGYFGLEGYYELELKGKPGIIRQEKDATGNPILFGDFGGYPVKDGRSLKLYLDRSIQRLVEAELKDAMELYGAKSGEVIVMDPTTGGILANASLPAYDPREFNKFEATLYRNPTVADAYEPGSTFKVLVMSAGLDTDVVKPDTKCDICTGPVDIGKYTIRTWNDEYHPNSTMTEVIQHSDNVGMVFVGQKLGKDRLVDYLKKFDIGEPTGIDVQEETVPPIRQKWGDIDVATSSFGQGIAVTAMQMIKAVGAIANKGVMMKPQFVKQIIGDQTVDLKPQAIRRVISEQSASEMTDMMVNQVESGEAQWTKLKGYRVAGKTGTAQIPVAGHYDREKTIASFIGFAPADHPKFVMIVKLREPTSSPWAAETAAPLWMRLAKKILLYYGVPPEN